MLFCSIEINENEWTFYVHCKVLSSGVLLGKLFYENSWQWKYLSPPPHSKETFLSSWLLVPVCQSVSLVCSWMYGPRSLKCGTCTKCRYIKIKRQWLPVQTIGRLSCRLNVQTTFTNNRTLSKRVNPMYKPINDKLVTVENYFTHWLWLYLKLRI